MDLYPDAREPIWFGDRKVFTVTGFVLGVRSRIVDLPMMWVQGEVSNFNPKPQARTVFFTLKDPENGYRLDCTMQLGVLRQLGLNISDGDLIQCLGRADIYAPRGNFQLRVQGLEHAGRGLLMQQLDALRERLAAEGLFLPERKRVLPMLPRRVGLITGSGAAAQGDFMRNVNARYPPVKIAMVETLVQGPRAAPEIVAALRKLDAVADVDVIVVTRGGGAFEDFLPFCDERVLRAIAQCETPVVSAIGHEKDSPISDLVADLRCATPTEAARTVVPDHAELVESLDRSRMRIKLRTGDRFRAATIAMASLRSRLTARSPRHIVIDRRRFVAQLRSRATGVVSARIAHSRQGQTLIVRSMRRACVSRYDAIAARHSGRVGQLRALSPQNVLERGYAIVRSHPGMSIVRSPEALGDGARVTMLLAGGDLSATLIDVGRGIEAASDHGGSSE